MCLVTKELPQIAKKDIICYKVFNKKENHNFRERLLHFGLKYRIESPCIGTDFTFEVLTKGTLIARGAKRIRVIPKRKQKKNWLSYDISFNEIKTYKNIDLYNNHIDYFEYTSGMIHAFSKKVNHLNSYNCVCECIIPKGALYVRGKYNEICAEKIVIKKIINCDS